jgi:nucleolar MIF4G domain-containing protein 1
MGVELTMGDLLDFADMIGPGGKGLKRDRADSDEDEDDDDSDEDEDDLDDMDLSVGSEMDAEEDEDADTDPDDLISEGEPSELDDGIQSSQEEAEIDLSENEVSDSGDLEEEEEKEAAAAAAATKYVPPHMRAAQLAEKAQGSKEKALSRQKLERKLQGLLNK